MATGSIMGDRDKGLQWFSRVRTIKAAGLLLLQAIGSCALKCPDRHRCVKALLAGIFLVRMKSESQKQAEAFAGMAWATKLIWLAFSMDTGRMPVRKESPHKHLYIGRLFMYRFWKRGLIFSAPGVASRLALSQLADIHLLPPSTRGTFSFWQFQATRKTNNNTHTQVNVKF